MAALGCRYFDILLGVHICDCKSSANECSVIECESMIVDTGLMHMQKETGP